MGNFNTGQKLIIKHVRVNIEGKFLIYGQDNTPNKLYDLVYNRTIRKINSFDAYLVSSVKKS